MLTLFQGCGISPVYRDMREAKGGFQFLRLDLQTTNRAAPTMSSTMMTSIVMGRIVGIAVGVPGAACPAAGLAAVVGTP